MISESVPAGSRAAVGPGVEPALPRRGRARGGRCREFPAWKESLGMPGHEPGLPHRYEIELVDPAGRWVWERRGTRGRQGDQASIVWTTTRLD